MILKEQGFIPNPICFTGILDFQLHLGSSNLSNAALTSD